MADRHGPQRLPNALRRSLTGWRAFAFLAAQIPVAALALQGPAIPSAPAPPVPSGVPSAMPSALPSALPKAPKAPSAPSASPFAPPAPGAPSAAPAATGAPAAEPSPPPQDANVVLYGEEAPQTDEKGVPRTLPRELRRNVNGGQGDVQDRKEGSGVTIEEIVNPPVITASNRKDSALASPAWVIVLTAKDLRDRGYSELSQVLDDLPGMDPVRPYGDVYVRNYMRGFRQAWADPFLVMVDGVIFNQLFFRDSQILPAFPLSNIDHVEIVYGPASAVYGANAATGVINIITADGRKEQAGQEYGVALDARLTFGGPQRNFTRFNDTTKVVDANVLYTAKDYRLRLTGRFESSVLDTSLPERYPYLNAPVLRDPSVWSGALLKAYPDVTGSFRSANTMAAVDARIYIGQGTELAAQFFTFVSGDGTEYPPTVVQPQASWNRRELSIYARHAANFTSNVSSASMVQFRRSDIATPSSYSQRDPALGQAWFAALESPNLSVLVTQDFDIVAGRSLLLNGDQLTIGTGLRYQHLELNGGDNGYTTLSDVRYPITCTDPTLCPPTNGGSIVNDTRPTIPADEFGAYVLAKYAIQPTNAIHLGARIDHSPIYFPFKETSEQTSDAHNITPSEAGFDVSVRGGYVGTFFDRLTVKALYGQAVYQPGSFEIRRPYCAQGTFSNGTCNFTDADTGAARTALPQVADTQRSQSAELNLDFTLPWLALHADGYYSQYSNPIIACATTSNQDGIAFVNLDNRQVVGMDVSAQLLYKPIRFWAYYSHYFLTEDSVEGDIDPCSDTTKPDRTRVGDLANDKVLTGFTFDKAPVTATLLARFIGPRETVGTNPVNTIPWYWLMDANIMVSNVPWRGFWFGVRSTNIFDVRYSHPGIDMGSGTFYSVQHPQPGRAFFATIGLNFHPDGPAK